jgi:hypothetical protein
MNIKISEFEEAQINYFEINALEIGRLHSLDDNNKKKKKKIIRTTLWLGNTVTRDKWRT